MKTFDDVRALLENARNGDGESAEELWKLMGEAESVATDIFRGKEDSYVMDMVTLIMSVSMAYFTSTGRLDFTKAIYLSKDSDILSLLSMCIKISIGFAAMEELR